MRTLLKQIFAINAEKPRQALLKGTALVAVAPITLLVILVTIGELDLTTALYAAAGVFIAAIVFVWPYVNNLASLTRYVWALAHDETAEAPDLSFLNNVEELTGAINGLHAIWERRRRELEATIAEGRILIDSLPDIILMLDKEGKVIRTNSRAREVFGEKFYGETLAMIMRHPDISNATAQVLADHQGRTEMFFLPEPYAKHYMVRIERFPVFSPGDIAAILVMHDITELKHTEQVLSDFVANASHEIRTPLTSISGLIETMQTVAKDDAPAREEFLQVMAGQAERMSKLVNGLLSLSQIERNIHNKPTGRVHLPVVLRAIQGQMSVYADERDMTINLEIKEEIPTITGDVDEMTLLFENLVSNAIKYGHESTDILIRVWVEENTLQDEAALREYSHVLAVAVQDKGIGIEARHLPRLTERFFRVDMARSRKVKGTGLGLAIVKYILERHHGVMHVESQPGRGSTFTVYLPVETEETKRG